MPHQLSSLDAAFLDLESPTGHLHCLGVITLPAGRAPLGLEELRALVGERLPGIDVLHRRLATSPGGLDRPYWVDVAPDLDRHVRHVDLSDRGPGGMEAFCAEVAAARLDRSLPMWEMWLADGVGGGQALVIKVHHSLCDGIASLAVVAQLLDTDPDVVPPGAEAGAGEPVTPEDEPPEPLAMLARGAANLVRWPLDAARVAAELTSSVARVARLVGSGEHRQLAAPLATPAMPFGGPVTERRVLALRDLPLDRVKAVARAAGAHVNDVVLAVATGALRAWLVDRDALPDRAVVAAVPISTRTAEQLFDPGNHVSAYFALLPVHVASARDRLEVTAASSRDGKALHEALGPATLDRLTGLLVPSLAAAPADAYGRLGLARAHPAPVNLIVSDVAGPTIPLYLAGREAGAFYAIGPIFDGVPLNITAVSYHGNIGVGYLSCPVRFPDLHGLADRQAGAMEELAAAYGV